MCGSERLTGAWLKAILASILAKGDSADQNSYGGESLLSVQRGKKTSAKIAASRSEPVLEGMVGREKQHGFRSG